VTNVNPASKGGLQYRRLLCAPRKLAHSPQARSLAFAFFYP